nr:WD repeat-containing protein 55 [Ipomoea batatas]
MNALSARHVEVDDLCPLCRLNLESLGHLFYGCMHVAPLWNDFIDYPPPGATADFMTWFSNLFVNGSLVLTYLDRFRFKGRKIERIAPAITTLTVEAVKKRIKSEIFSRQFGRGKAVTSVLRKMDDTVVEFAEVMAEIGNTRTRGGIIKKTFENTNFRITATN